MNPLIKVNIKDLPTLLPHSIDWVHYFGNHFPLDVEIGCGRPHFFFDRATNHPDRNIVAMEWVYEFVEQAQRRIVRQHIENATAFHGNAWLLLPMLFRANAISYAFVNFPDPWWKNKHKKRLILNEIFLDALRERMRDEGAIVLQTDVRPLFDFYCNLLHKHNAFTYDSTKTEMDIIAFTNAKTHREKKCLEQGLPIYRGSFTVRN